MIQLILFVYDFSVNEGSHVKNNFLYGKACQLDSTTSSGGYITGSSVVIWKILIVNGRYTVQCMYIHMIPIMATGNKW